MSSLLLFLLLGVFFMATYVNQGIRERVCGFIGISAYNPAVDMVSGFLGWILLSAALGFWPGLAIYAVAMYMRYSQGGRF